ncbi:MAG: RHS repeat-associated core domain-containing protein [Chlamydiae bacterium]|nr:RHS repeat-associated core domain-containing protein [Chlamydiota bacterium]
MRYVLIGLTLVFSFAFSSKKMELMTEGEVQAFIQKDESGRITKFKQNGVEWAFNFDSKGRLKKIHRDKRLAVEYIRNHQDYDLIIRSKDFCYWIVRGDKRLDYGDFVSQKSGYRLLDEHNRCYFEKFMHGVEVNYSIAEGSSKITVNQSTSFELKGDAVFSSKKNGSNWPFEELLIEGTALKYDETNALIEAQIFNQHHRFFYDNEDQLVEEELLGKKICHSYAPGRGKITSDNQSYNVVLDDLERCSSLSSDGKKFSFMMDPFGRVLEILQEDKPPIQLFYHNFDEIGSIQNNEVKDFRFVRHEEGYEEPKTLFIFSGGKGYNVRTDLFGNIVELIDADSGLSKEKVFYSAFGESLNGLSSISPWGYRSKRWLEDLDLYLFTFRFYSPFKGKFLSPDPAGFDHTLNRTCYCLNNPIRFCDPKGNYLGIHLNRSQKYAVGVILDFLGKHLPLTLSKGYELQCFAARYMGLEQPEIFEQDHAFEINESLGEKDTSFIFVNGISTEKPVAEHLCYDLSMMLKQKFRCVHLATQGAGRDLFNSVKEYLGIKTPGVLILENLIQNLLNDPERKIVIFSHSRGALATDLALRNLTNEEKQRIEVYSFGGAIFIHRGFMKRARNFVSKGDPIPFILDFKSYMFGEKWFDVDIEFLDIGEGGISFFDHAILGSTYRTRLHNLVKEYQTQYCCVDVE